MNKNGVLLFILLCIAVPASVSGQTVGGGDLTFSAKGARDVIFSHTTHVNIKGLKCSACHYQVFQMTKGSYKITMTSISKGDFCGKCHNGQRSFDARDPINCKRCHRGQDSLI